jgi:hypothetical protein
MTREQMIADLCATYQRCTDAQRARPLVKEPDRTWNFTQIMEQVFLQTPSGIDFIDRMIQSRQAKLN